MINGDTELIAHIGYPTHTFKSPMIYNPYFASSGINAVVVPMGCKPDHYPAFLQAVFSLENIRGALITMPHKVSTVELVDELLPAAAMLELALGAASVALPDLASIRSTLLPHVPVPSVRLVWRM